jgi:hypothetical protein
MPQEVKFGLFCGSSGQEFGDALDLEENELVLKVQTC